MTSQAPPLQQRPHPIPPPLDNRHLGNNRPSGGPHSAGLSRSAGLPALHPNPPSAHSMPSYHSPTHSHAPNNKPGPGMYHRSMPAPGHPHHPPDRSASSRMLELMDALKNEVESVAENVSVYKSQRDEYEIKLGHQVNELSSFQQNLYELERAHQAMKQRLEEEIERLHRELDSVRNQGRNGTTARGFPEGPAPNVGSGNGLFAPIMQQQQQQQQQTPSQDRSEHPPKRMKLDEGSYPPPNKEQPAVTGECVLRNESIPPTFKQQGKDWFAVLNPQSPALSGSPLKLDLLYSFDHSSVVCCIKFSACGHYVATGCNHLTTVYDVQNGEKIAQVFSFMFNASVLGHIPPTEEGNPPADLYIRSVVFSPDRQLLATGAEDRVVRIWNIEKQELVWTLTGHTLEIYSLDWSKDGKIIVSGSGDKSIKVWDAEKGECMTTIASVDEKTDVSSSKDAGVTGVAINSVYPFCIAAGSLDRIVRVWDYRTGTLLERFEGHQDSVYSVAFSPDGRSIVSGALDQTLKVWDLSQKTLSYLSQTQASQDAVPFDQPVFTYASRHTFVGHKDFVLSVGFAGTNASFGRVDEAGNPVATLTGDALAEVEWVVSGSKDWSVIFWDAKAPKSAPVEKRAAPQFLLQGHENSVISVALSPSQGLFATGGGDCKARIWRVSAAVASSGTMPPAGPSSSSLDEGSLTLPKIQDIPEGHVEPPTET